MPLRGSETAPTGRSSLVVSWSAHVPFSNLLTLPAITLKQNADDCTRAGPSSRVLTSVVLEEDSLSRPLSAGLFDAPFPPPQDALAVHRPFGRSPLWTGARISGAFWKGLAAGAFRGHQRPAPPPPTPSGLSRPPLTSTPCSPTNLVFQPTMSGIKPLLSPLPPASPSLHNSA